MERLLALGCLFSLLSVADVSAEAIFTVSDATFISDGVTPTTGVIPVELVVTAEVDAVPGDPVLAWDLEALDVTSIAGGISDVSLDSFNNGTLFDGFTSFLTVSPTQPYTLSGTASMGTTPPTEPVLSNGATFFLFDFTVPAGETGTFDVVLNGADGLGQFGIFDATNTNGYSNVSVNNGTITITTVPEPSAFPLLGMAAGLLVPWIRGRRRSRG